MREIFLPDEVRALHRAVHTLSIYSDLTCDGYECVQVGSDIKLHAFIHSVLHSFLDRFLHHLKDKVVQLGPHSVENF